MLVLKKNHPYARAFRWTIQLAHALLLLQGLHLLAAVISAFKSDEPNNPYTLALALTVGLWVILTIRVGLNPKLLRVPAGAVGQVRSLLLQAAILLALALATHAALFFAKDLPNQWPQILTAVPLNLLTAIILSAVLTESN